MNLKERALRGMAGGVLFALLTLMPFAGMAVIAYVNNGNPNQPLQLGLSLTPISFTVGLLIGLTQKPQTNQQNNHRDPINDIETDLITLWLYEELRREENERNQ